MVVSCERVYSWGWTMPQMSAPLFVFDVRASHTFFSSCLSVQYIVILATAFVCTPSSVSPYLLF